MAGLFELHFKEWVESACKDWQHQKPPKAYYDDFYKRIPYGVRAMLGEGIRQNIIIPQGHKFFIEGPAKKGPYSWVSNYSSADAPHPNWEYYPQVALYSHLYDTARSKGLTLIFQDDCMDLALYKGSDLLVYIEVKETANQLKNLILGIKRYQGKVDLLSPDRGNDPLRKAKYIVSKKPAYFCGWSIGARFDFRVQVFTDETFQLDKDIIPWA